MLGLAQMAEELAERRTGYTFAGHVPAERIYAEMCPDSASAEYYAIIDHLQHQREIAERFRRIPIFANECYLIRP